MMNWQGTEWSFEHPWFLWGLLAIPILLGWFLVKQRQYWRDAFDFSQVAVVKQLKHQRHSIWLQRVLPLLMMLSLTSGIIGLANPQMTTRVATHKQVLMLVLDISISMEAKDFRPNRLEAAKSAAIEFVRSLPRDIRIGLEYFAGNSYLITPPIDDHRRVTALLRGLEMSDLRPGTAIGDALIVSMDSLHGSLNTPEEADKPSPKPAKHEDGTIILITDGESNLGVSPYVAVEQAHEHGVQIFTIGIGEETGAYVRGGIFTQLDEPTLEFIAQQTGGEFYRAHNLSDFDTIYKKITHQALHYEEKTLSLMWVFLAFSTLATGLGFWWSVSYRRF